MSKKIPTQRCLPVTGEKSRAYRNFEFLTVRGKAVTHKTLSLASYWYYYD